MFKLDRFIEDCIAAQREGESQKAIREVLAGAVAMPNELLEALGEPGVGFPRLSCSGRPAVLVGRCAQRPARAGVEPV